jgi:hypothetical protein
MAPRPGPTPIHSSAAVHGKECAGREGRLTVNPVFSVEGAGDDAGAETASWVERAAGVVYADEFGDEECEPDADGGDEGSC